MSTQTTCKNCNATLDEGTVFCPMCGTKREVTSPPEKNVFCSKCGKPSGAELAFVRNVVILFVKMPRLLPLITTMNQKKILREC